MQIMLVFSSREFCRYLNIHLDFPTVRVAMNVFLGYCLECYQQGRVFDDVEFREYANDGYLTAVENGELRDLINISDEVATTAAPPLYEYFLEVLEVVMFFFKDEVMGCLFSISSDIRLRSLAVYEFSRERLLVRAFYNHLLPAGEQGLSHEIHAYHRA